MLSSHCLFRVWLHQPTGLLMPPKGFLYKTDGRCHPPIPKDSSVGFDFLLVQFKLLHATFKKGSTTGPPLNSPFSRPHSPSQTPPATAWDQSSSPLKPSILLLHQCPRAAPLVLHAFPASSYPKFLLIFYSPCRIRTSRAVYPTK